ncbi:hypothetical protein D3C81_1563910 [compost metagenome]
MDRFDALNNPVRRDVLQQISAGPVAQCFDNILIIVKGGQHQYGYLRIGCFDAAGPFDAITVRHPDIHQYDIGMRKHLEQCECFMSIPGTAHDFNLSIQSDKYHQTLADKRIVVNNHYFYH